MVRVLNITNVLQAAGIESFIMNMYRNIDRDKVQFDFMVMRDQPEYYDAEIKGLGGKKYTVTVKENNQLIKVLKESRQLYRFLRKHPYKIIHIHYTTPLKAFYLLAAKQAGVPVRIYHSHSAAVSGKSALKLKIYAYCRRGIGKWGTHYWACSKAAAEWIFSGKALAESIVIPNGIDTKRFAFDEEKRDAVRKELGLADEFVIVNTGRFLEQKNHRFIIDVFSEFIKKKKGKLLLMGTGPLEDEIKEYAVKKGVRGQVMFLGVRSDVDSVLSAADCYIMPSLYEGLPVAAVEAQASGLPCILSDAITKEIKLRDNVTFLSLNEPVDKWVSAILKVKANDRLSGQKDVADGGYDIRQCAADLQSRYEKMAKRGKYDRHKRKTE